MARTHDCEVVRGVVHTMRSRLNSNSRFFFSAITFFGVSSASFCYKDVSKVHVFNILKRVNRTHKQTHTQKDIQIKARIREHKFTHTHTYTHIQTRVCK